MSTYSGFIRFQTEEDQKNFLAELQVVAGCESQFSEADETLLLGYEGVHETYMFHVRTIANIHNGDIVDNTPDELLC